MNGYSLIFEGGVISQAPLSAKYQIERSVGDYFSKRKAVAENEQQGVEKGAQIAFSREYHTKFD